MRQYVRDKEQVGEEPWKMGPDQKPLSESTLYRYVALASERISEACLAQEKDAVHLHLSQRRGLYARAVEDGDFRTALCVLQDLARLADLYPSETHVPPRSRDRLPTGPVPARRQL